MKTGVSYPRAHEVATGKERLARWGSSLPVKVLIEHELGKLNGDLPHGALVRVHARLTKHLNRHKQDRHFAGGMKKQ